MANSLFFGGRWLHFATPPRASPQVPPVPGRAWMAPSHQRTRSTPEFPVAPVVRNTFVEFPTPRDPSLEEWLQEREVKSEPPSGSLPSAAPRPLAPPTDAAVFAVFAAEVAPGRSAPEHASVGVTPRSSGLGAQGWRPSGDLDELVAGDSDGEEYGEFDQPLENMLPHPEVLRPVSWSVGSAGHIEGRCKPCAFLHREEGCLGGELCSFCHLCPPGEKKRRKQQKHAIRRLAGVVRHQMWGALHWGGQGHPASSSADARGFSGRAAGHAPRRAFT